MNKWLAFILMFFPSRIKVMLLRVMGHDVHPSAYIGFSYLNVRKIILRDKVYIGPGNIFTQLEKLELEKGSRINRWNRFTSNRNYHGVMHLKHNASVSLRHYFDVCDLVQVGPNTIIAGHRSTFFTHSKGLDTIDYTKPIVIGEYCYLGSNIAVAPGAQVGDHCFVGMGSVVVGDMSYCKYALIAGNPAIKKRDLSENAKYFLQGDIKHAHLQGE